MSKQRGSRVLTWALGVSIAVHLVLAMVTRAIPPAIASDEKPPQHIRIEERYRPTPPPTPQPTPTPQPAHRVLARHSAAATAVHRVYLQSQTTIIASSSVVAPVSTGEAESPSAGMGTAPGTISGNEPGTPEPAPTPACAQPNAAAETVNVIAPEIPDAASSWQGTVLVAVSLTATGTIDHLAIYRSGGDPLLDRAALAAARATTYHAEMRDCVPVAGTYIFRAEFQQ